MLLYGKPQLNNNNIKVIIRILSNHFIKIFKYLLSYFKHKITCLNLATYTSSRFFITLFDKLNLTSVSKVKILVNTSILVNKLNKCVNV